MRSEVYSASRIGRALQYHVVLKLLNLLLGFAFQIVLVKNLHSPDFASYAVLLAIVMIGQMALSFGIYKTISRFVPNFTVNRDFASLGSLISKLVLVRLVSLVLLVAGIVANRSALQHIVPVHLEASAFIGFAVWFAAYIIFMDAEAFAQSWAAHSTSAVVGVLEIAARIAVIWLLIRGGALNIDTLMMGMAATAMGAAIIVMSRLFRIFSRIRSSASPDAGAPVATALNIKGVSFFAFANYLSSISWGISSPPIVRIVGAAGLQVVSLAAFSFAQGLLTSLQRALPGLLLLSSVEPLLIAKFTSSGRSDRVMNALSLIYKLDLICILGLLSFTIIAGDDVLRILSKPEYATYSFLLPALVILLELNTIYLVLEMIANVNLKHRIFGMLWPIGAISIALIFFTIGHWGLLSVLLWPIVDGVSKNIILLLFFRNEKSWRVLDPIRSGSMVLVTACIVALSVSLQHFVLQASAVSNLMLAGGAVVALGISLVVIRPFRPAEYEVVSTIMPSSLRPLRLLLSLGVRP